MRHEFPITLAGEGDTPEEAWQDATESFSCDPGATPDEFLVENEDGEMVSVGANPRKSRVIVVVHDGVVRRVVSDGDMDVDVLDFDSYDRVEPGSDEAAHQEELAEEIKQLKQVWSQ